MNVSFRSVAVPTLACLAVLTVAPPRAWAQPALSAAEQAGRTRGHLDGSREGEDDGAEEGRGSVLVEDFIRGFSRGVHERVDERATEEAWAAGREESWDAGNAEGLAQGRIRGREQARDAYARLTGKPAFRGESAPVAAGPAPPSTHAACPPAQVITLDPTRGTSVRLDPSDLERRGSPLPSDIPRPRLPDRHWMGEAARADGFTLPDEVTLWGRAYQHAFERAYEDEYEEAMEDVSHYMRQRHEEDGRRDGQREAERRARCDAFERGHQEGWRAGFVEGFRTGFEEEWLETAKFHDTHAVVRLDSAELRDASGDGVIEPDEELRAHVALTNAGLVDSTPAPLRWLGVQGMDAQGRLSGRIPAQSSHAEEVSLGTVDARALFESSVIVRLEPEGDEPSEIKARVGRPVELVEAAATIEARDGRSVALVRARLRSVARADTDRGLRLVSGEESVDVGSVRAGGTHAAELVVPVEPSTAVLGSVSGSVELQDGKGAFWMRREWSTQLTMAQAVALTGKLTEPDLAIAALSRRLRREYEAALADPKLYAKLASRSELAQYAQARLAVPAPVQTMLEQQVTAPLVRDSQEKSVPRKVRRGVRDALGLK